MEFYKLILLSVVVLLSFPSCSSKNSGQKKEEKMQHIFDGYVDEDDLSPGNFRNKYYFNFNILIDERDIVKLNNVPTPLLSILDSINTKWQIINNNEYAAFLNISLLSEKNANQKTYEQVYGDLISIRKGLKDKCSISKYGKKYEELDDFQKKIIGSKTLVNIAPSPARKNN